MSGGIAATHDRPEPHASLQDVKFTVSKKQLRYASTSPAAGTPTSMLRLFSQGISKQGQAEALGSVATVIELWAEGDGQTHN